MKAWLARVLKSAANGVVHDAMGLPITALHTDGMARIESNCLQLGWSIDERPDGNTIVLFFKDLDVGHRKVFITVNKKGNVAFFSVMSDVNLPTDHIPPKLGLYLLHRNWDDMMVSWHMLERENGNAGFYVNYAALVAGLEPELFGHICHALCKEVREVDKKLREGGLI